MLYLLGLLLVNIAIVVKSQGCDVTAKLESDCLTSGQNCIWNAINDDLCGQPDQGQLQCCEQGTAAPTTAAPTTSEPTTAQPTPEPTLPCPTITSASECTSILTSDCCVSYSFCKINNAAICGSPDASADVCCTADTTSTSTTSTTSTSTTSTSTTSTSTPAATTTSATTTATVTRLSTTKDDSSKPCNKDKDKKSKDKSWGKGNKSGNKGKKTTAIPQPISSTIAKGKKKTTAIPQPKSTQKSKGWSKGGGKGGKVKPTTTRASSKGSKTGTKSGKGGGKSTPTTTSKGSKTNKGSWSNSGKP